MDYKMTGLTFSEAYQRLKEGKCVKRAMWLGYWVTEGGGGNDVIMRCKNGHVVRMSEGCDPMFTLSNTLADDWMEVDEHHRAELDEIHASRLLAYKGDKR